MPTIYTSTDPSAPVVMSASFIADIANLWDKCTVAGYPGKAGAGWSKPFSDATWDVFRPGAGSRPFLRMRKVGYSDFTGFEQMTGTDTGKVSSTWPDTGGGNAAFHTQLNNTTVDPMRWIMFADARTAYLFIDTGAGSYSPGWFGDYYSYKPGDLYNAIFVPSISTKDTFPFFNPAFSGLATHYSQGHPSVAGMRGHSQAPLSAWMGLGLRGSGAVLVPAAGGGGSPRGAIPFPNPADGHIWLAPIYVHDVGVPSNRGKLRGLWHWAHPTGGVADRATFTGSGEFAGKTFMIIKDLDYMSQPGCWVVETSDTWITN